MKKSRIKLGFYVGLIATLFTIQSCKKDDPNPTTVEEQTISSSYANGVFITCEGAFGSGTGTLSFFDRNSNAAFNDVYNSVNSAALGNTVQSMTLFNGSGYIVVNNANKVEVVNSSTLKSSGKISGLTSPRYFLAIDATKAYVSQWGNGSADHGIQVVQLATNTVSSFISTGTGPDKMVKVGNFAYVVNSGGFGNDSIVSVINCSTDAVVASLNVGYNPNSIQVDKNGKIWVLCGGIPDYTTPSNGVPGKLICINPSNNAIEASFSFSSHADHASNLCINQAKDKLFFLENYSSGRLFSFDINSTVLPNTALVSRNFYSIGIDPKNDQIFTSVTNYSNGWILRYAANASLIDSFQVGVIPGNFCFN